MAVKATVLGGSAKELALDPAVFEAEVKPHLVHETVRAELNAARRGTRGAKSRGLVSGGRSKPWRQKGTGRARQGTIRAPQWAGGGIVFGPVPRGYEHALSKKTRRAALRCALSLRHKEGALAVVDALTLEAPRTRLLLDALTGLGLGESSVLVVIEAADRNLELAARNLPRVDVLRAEGLNVYDVLRHERLLLTQGALARVQQRLGASGEGTA